MSLPPDFYIHSSGQISTEFVKRNILTFKEAAEFVRHLPYGRNKNKDDLSTVFSDNCGTCSTKHALLKLLSDENHFEEIKLMIGLFKMSGKNTPMVSKTLQHNNLKYIPEAHCYVNYNDLILDFTKSNSTPENFIDDLIEEIEIQPHQISDYKVNYHKSYVEEWLDKNKHLHLSVNDFWEIREQCIRDLSDNNTLIKYV